MGYERNDRRGFGDDRYGRGRDSYDRGYNRDRGGPPTGYSYDDRGFFDRAGDEVRSWFGDEEAERRRRYDERYDDRYEAQADRGRTYGRDDWDRDQYARNQGYDRGTGSYAGGDYGRGRYTQDQNRSQGQGYGRDRADADRNRFATRAGGTASDDSYGSWRDRQLQTFDSDYDEYRRENQSRFDSEFSTYRNRRQGQRDLLGRVQEHQEVVGSDGQHVGTVDHVRGDRIRLTKNDQAAGGHHHSIPSSWIESVDDKVTISKTADEAKRAWREEADENDRNSGGGLFGRREESDRETDWSTDRNLNRSFSGTY